MTRTRAPAPRPDRFGAAEHPSEDGFETTPQQLRRVLRTRPAESGLRRAWLRSTGLFTGDDYPRRLAEAAAGAQAPVTTGRRIAVVGSRGGAGKSTVAALLARVFAATRADTVAAVDTAGSGTLGLRLGLPDAPPLDAVARRLGTDVPASLAGLASLLAVGGPANLLVAGRRGPAAQEWSDDAATHLARSISRYCPITLFDGGSPLADPAGRWAVDNSHLAVFVTSASVAGLEDAAEYAAFRQRDHLLVPVPLLVLVTQTSPGSPFVPALEAKRLARTGVSTAYLGYDRHLAAGVEVSPALLARRTRLEAAALASRVLGLAAGSSAAGSPAGPSRRSAAAGRRAAV